MIHHCCPDKIKEPEDDWIEFIYNELKALGKPLRCATGRALRFNLLAALGGFPLRSLLHRNIDKHASEFCILLKSSMNKAFTCI